MQEITDIDAKILKYIERRGSAEAAEIKGKFPNVSAIEYRLKTLSTPEYRKIGNVPFSIPKENSSYLRERSTSTVDERGITHVKALGIYELTEYGKRELQNYSQERSSARKELWLKNAWIPIIVSLITTAVANYILPKLPQILRWLSNTLSGIAS